MERRQFIGMLLGTGLYGKRQVAMFKPLNILKIMQKPSNRMYIQTSHCQFDLMVDDMPVNSFWGKLSEDGTGISSDNLLNPYILRSGEHEIRVKIYPRYGKDSLEFHSFFVFEVYTVDAATYDFDNKISLLSMQTPDDIHENGQLKNPLTGLPYYEMHATVRLQVPFNLTGWLNSVDLKKEDEKKDIYPEVWQTYRDVYNVIKNKDLNQFKSMIAEREDLLATAFYYNDKDKQDRWQSFVDVITNKDYELAPLPPRAKLTFYGYGKIVTLLDDGHDGIIKLVNKKDTTDQTIFDFIFQRKTKGDKLTII